MLSLSYDGAITHVAFHRLMSDYEVNLINDNIQEFYVHFIGPSESASFISFPVVYSGLTMVLCYSTVRRRSMEDSCGVTRSIPFQVT